ncbi:MAG: hypothetical protein PSN37_04230 [Alphaproteobacteria bacterium]|nr:hypothetical protein [Alphaproteobacteria bacterium]
MKISNIFIAILATLILSGCMTTPKPTMTSLEIRSIQSREYEAPKEVVFPSVISVFQDLGYTISNADIQTGLISAESSSESNSVISKILLGVTNVSQTRATAFVEQIRDKTNARLSFVLVNKSSSAWGQADRQDTPLLDARLYQNAFERIEDAIFIRSQNYW